MNSSHWPKNIYRIYFHFIWAFHLDQVTYFHSSSVGSVMKPRWELQTLLQIRREVSDVAEFVNWYSPSSFYAGVLCPPNAWTTSSQHHPLGIPRNQCVCYISSRNLWTWPWLISGDLFPWKSSKQIEYFRSLVMCTWTTKHV